MVYTGYELVCGIHFNNLEDLTIFFNNVVYGTRLNQLINNLKINTKLDNQELINNFLSDEGYKMDVHIKKCCYNDGSYILGYSLGSTNFVNRNSVDTYNNFEAYYTGMHRQLSKIENKWVDTQIEIRKEFSNLRKLYEATNDNYSDSFQDSGEIDDVFNIMFYKYANDCDSCS